MNTYAFLTKDSFRVEVKERITILKWKDNI